MSPWRTLQFFRPVRSSRSRDGQHVERQIEAKATLDIGCEQFEHAAGAGAEVEQRADRLVGKRGADCLFDRGVRDMQLADAVPLAGVTPEITLRCRGAGGTDRRQPLGPGPPSDRWDRAG